MKFFKNNRNNCIYVFVAVICALLFVMILSYVLSMLNIIEMMNTLNSGYEEKKYQKQETTEMTVQETLPEVSKPATLPKKSEKAKVKKVKKKAKKNTLYYILDDGLRYDCPSKYQKYLWNLCVKKKIKKHYKLLLAQMYHESGFDPKCKSSTDDYGIMQINSCNHKWLSRIVGDDNFLNPYTSMRAGVYLMSHYIEKYKDVHKALVCYNMGESKVSNDGIYESRYSRGVVQDMKKLKPIKNKRREKKHGT